MRYISTRGNHPAVASARAIGLGMVPEGGLFVPESIPQLPQLDSNAPYKETAYQVLAPFLSDFSDEELRFCINNAYSETTFDTDSVINLIKLNPAYSIMELWHGPTAAFKDIALQIMPWFLKVSKEKIGNNSHTVILVATSGDTGKAALEGFKNCDGISIVVFYPDEGVSEIQKLQMSTTDGKNTFVVAVQGNFDDCQTGVKRIFSDPVLRKELANKEFELSSANSINWGRLCPQIVYYIKSYQTLVCSKQITYGDPVNFCVPTGNFGNILAAYYAKLMGLPINKLICASNRNNILSDFFSSGIYNINREFYRTNSPSMDILISSNLERFLFEITGHDASKITTWYDELGTSGSFQIDDQTRERIDSLIVSGWVDEKQVLQTIRNVYDKNGYILDTHTAVGMAVCNTIGPFDNHTVIASTASPYKFSCSVLGGIEQKTCEDEFSAIEQISSLTGKPVHRAVDRLRDRPLHHNTVITIEQMNEQVRAIIESLKVR